MGTGKKVALLIGVGEYGRGLKPLQCPANGVAELQGILAEPAIGDFDDVIPLVNPDVGTMRSRMGEVCSRLEKPDLLLFYFTGHGIKDMTGEFYLTTSQTQLFENGRLNPGTAVEASFVKSIIGNCYAQRKVIILDCCFGAAFAEGFLTMDDGRVDVQADLGGEGWVVLTAATSRNYALEHEGEPLSVYTRYLVEGLKTGAAAPIGQEYVLVEELYEYVRNKVQTAAPTMQPSIFNARRGNNIKLAKVTISDPVLRYRKEVEKYIRNFEITSVGKRILQKLAVQLNLSKEQVLEIESEVLKPYTERLHNLREYEAAHREAMQSYGLPFPEEVRQQLNQLKSVLNLRDQDINESKAITSKLIRKIDNTLSAKNILKNDLANFPEKSATFVRKHTNKKPKSKNQKSLYWKNIYLATTLSVSCIVIAVSFFSIFRAVVIRLYRDDNSQAVMPETNQTPSSIPDHIEKDDQPLKENVSGKSVITKEPVLSDSEDDFSLYSLLPNQEPLVVEDSLSFGQSRYYPFFIEGRQKIILEVETDKRITFGVFSPDDDLLETLDAVNSKWEGYLEDVGTHTIRVRSSVPENKSFYQMHVSLED